MSVPTGYELPEDAVEEIEDAIDLFGNLNELAERTKVVAEKPPASRAQHERDTLVTFLVLHRKIRRLL